MARMRRRSFLDLGSAAPSATERCRSGAEISSESLITSDFATAAARRRCSSSRGRLGARGTAPGAGRYIAAEAVTRSRTRARSTGRILSGAPAFRLKLPTRPGCSRGIAPLVARHWGGRGTLRGGDRALRRLRDAEEAGEEAGDALQRRHTGLSWRLGSGSWSVCESKEALLSEALGRSSLTSIGVSAVTSAATISQTAGESLKPWPLSRWPGRGVDAGAGADDRVPVGCDVVRSAKPRTS